MKIDKRQIPISKKMPMKFGSFTIKRKLYLVLIIAFSIILSSCSFLRPHKLAYRLTPPSIHLSSGDFLSGAGKKDITPPPGYPKGGFSIAGAVSRGVWLHLYSRAIYLEDQKGTPLVLVSCDLVGIPGGLVDFIAEILSQDEKLSHIGRQHIILAATHTHHSPGNYFTSELYNKYASQEEGFDPILFEFLAHQIYQSIRIAYESRQPADIFYTAKPLFKVSRNRSLPAFKMNPDREEILKENRELLGVSTNEPEEDIAVNPLLQVLRITSGTNPPQTIAIAAFYAVHPTVIHAETEVYNSDLFGVAATLVEQDFIRERGPDGSIPIVALFNGAEGDISPRWAKQNRSTALDLGSKLAQGIVDLYHSEGKKIEGEISIKCKWTNLSNQSFIDDNGNEFRTAKKGKVGAPALGGAEDGRSPLYELGWKEGLKADEPSPDHGVKLDPLNPTPSNLTQPIADFLHIFAPEPDPPSEFILGVYSVGSIFLVPLPGEFSVTLGRRIVKAVQKHTSTDDIVLLVGCSGEHMSYFVTPEEYDSQQYEGASMLYGPYAGHLIQSDVGRLLKNPVESIYTSPKRRYDTGGERHFKAKSLVSITDFPYGGKGLASLLKDGLMEIPIENYPKLVWGDRWIKWPPFFIQKSPLYPRVEIREKLTNNKWVTLTLNGIPETDEGLNFITVLLEAGDNTSRWGTIWIPPKRMEEYPGPLRFSVVGLDGEIRFSTPFYMKEVITEKVSEEGTIKSDEAKSVKGVR